MAHPTAKLILDKSQELHRKGALTGNTENACIMRMDTGPDDMKMAAAAAGRRLRTRPAKINYYADCEVIEEEEKACKSKQVKNRGRKRKAEVNIESLYRQENMKEVPSTPLETIYELPQRGRGRGMKGKSREEDEMTILSDMCDLNLPVMTKRKIKRLCLFTSHYYPSKQKTLLRRERAQLMKELRGVNIPDGATISIEDVDAVLSCLSNEDQDENNQNVMNKSSQSVFKSGFYVGNVIRPDVQDDSTVDDIIQNMGTLKMNTSEVSSGIHSAVDDTVISPMLIDELIPSLPFNDEPTESSSQNSRKKKSRRRSGRLSGCLLPPVVKTSGNTSSGTYQISEQPCAPEQFTSLDKPIVATALSGEELQNSLRHEKCESPTVFEEFSGISNPEQKKPPAKKTLRVNARRKSVNKRKKKDENISNQVDELRTVAEDNAIQMRPSSEQVNGSNKVSEMKRRKKRPNKSGVESDMKKRKDIKPDNSSEICAKEPGELETNVNSKRCKKREKGNKGEKRRVSGIIRPLYSTMVELSSPDTPKNNESKRSFFEFEDVEKDSVNRTEQKSLYCPVATVTQEGASTFSSPTMGTSDNNVCHHSPTSPSTQMAALNLCTDKSPVDSVNSCQSPPTHLKKNKKNGQRRSARLSTGFTASKRLVDTSSWGLGSYWSSWSPSTCITKNVGTADSTDVEGRYSSMQPSELIVHELQSIEKSDTERGCKEMVISAQGRRHSGFVPQQDLIAVADEKSKSTDMKNTYNARDNTAGTTSVGNPSLLCESDSLITQGSHPGTKGHSICNVKECDNHQSRVLAHNARNIGVTLEDTCGVKTQERSVNNLSRQNLFELENEKQDTNITTLTMKNLHGADEKTRNIDIVDCSRPDINISQDSKKIFMDHDISSHSSFVFSNPPQHLKTQSPDISNHIVLAAQNVKHNGPPVFERTGNNLVPIVYSGLPIMSTISSCVSGSQGNLIITSTSVTSTSTQSSAHHSSASISSTGGCFSETHSSDDTAWNSSIISGIFENRTVIRQGTIYQNKDIITDSLITRDQLHGPQS